MSLTVVDPDELAAILASARGCRQRPAGGPRRRARRRRCPPDRLLSGGTPASGGPRRGRGPLLRRPQRAPAPGAPAARRPVPDHGRAVAKNWDPLDLRAADAPPPLMRVGPGHAPDRVEFADAALAAALAERCPDLHRREGAGGTARLVLWSVAPGSRFCSLRFSAYRTWLRCWSRWGRMPSRRVSAPWSSRRCWRVLGHPRPLHRRAGAPPSTASSPGSSQCGARRIAAGGHLAVSVRRHDMANALALPGARGDAPLGLIARAKSPSTSPRRCSPTSSACRARDPTRALIQASGTSFLLSLVLGDLTGSTVIVAVGEALLSAGYSREAERAADAYAVD